MCKKECEEFSDEDENSAAGGRGHTPEVTPPRSHTCHSVAFMENHDQDACLKSPKGKGRVKSACKRVFLGNDSSSEEEPVGHFESWDGDSVERVGWESRPAACSDDDAHIVVKYEEDAEPENSWGRPLTSDDLSSESSDGERETALRSSSRGRRGVPLKHTDMVLKLRKVYYGSGRPPRYQRVTDHPEDLDTARDGCRHHQGAKKSCRGSPYGTCALGIDDDPEACGSRHCPCLSGQRASRHSRRRVLRSAMHGTERATRSGFPDLVGKRIRHLYEENDKTEVWYRGVVLRVHEPHPNPLKTVFEVKYDSEPEWQYYLELLVDYKKGWLQIED
ncbi:uncharacterized protein C15orf39 homolog isoform X2 [Brachyhypopomus gauderio]|uniref:uncharacterized protein C15orf39 homolog isoform X2 n=1 Tax=Brachyhypopomus gauderio TaxID=698409 RepID=UPI004041EB3D